jgi:1-acyl-sn-glycerol-3-phosphate acyltransferase
MTAETASFHRSFLQSIWYWLFRALGWDADYREPGAPKYIIIVWPHTSNWDFPIGFIFSRAYPMPRPHFLAKNSVFKGILGPIARWAGGIPVDRSKSTNFVDQVAAEFNRHERFVLAVTPEGTRSKTHYWKSGFYYMALAANVPIVMATIDYAKKLVSYGASFMPSGNLEADFEIIRRFYAGAQGRHPERQGEIRLRPNEPTDKDMTGQDAPAA